MARLLFTMKSGEKEVPITGVSYSNLFRMKAGTLKGKEGYLRFHYRGDSSRPPFVEARLLLEEKELRELAEQFARMYPDLLQGMVPQEESAAAPPPTPEREPGAEEDDE